MSVTNIISEPGVAQEKLVGNSALSLYGKKFEQRKKMREDTSGLWGI